MGTRNALRCVLHVSKREPNAMQRLDWLQPHLRVRQTDAPAEANRGIRVGCAAQQTPVPTRIKQAYGSGALQDAGHVRKEAALSGDNYMHAEQPLELSCRRLYTGPSHDDDGHVAVGLLVFSTLDTFAADRPAWCVRCEKQSFCLQVLGAVPLARRDCLQTCCGQDAVQQQ